jgi:hypothetical protein
LFIILLYLNFSLIIAMNHYFSCFIIIICCFIINCFIITNCLNCFIITSCFNCFIIFIINSCFNYFIINYFIDYFINPNFNCFIIIKTFLNNFWVSISLLLSIGSLVYPFNIKLLIIYVSTVSINFIFIIITLMIL